MEQKNELLSYLRIKNLYLDQGDGITFVICPLKISSLKMELLNSAVLEEKNYILCFEFSNNEKIKIVCSVEKNPENNSYILWYEDPLPECFEKQLKELDNIYYNFDKRSEARFEIGLEKWQSFGLIRPDCFFIYQDHKVRVILSNVSYHGALLLGERSYCSMGELVTFSASFTDGNVVQKANVIKTEQVTHSYFKYYVQFVEPLSILWIKKINSLN